MKKVIIMYLKESWMTLLKYFNIIVTGCGFMSKVSQCQVKYTFGRDCFVILPRSDVIAKTRNEDEETALALT